MSQNNTTHEFEMNFDEYIESIHSDLAYWEMLDETEVAITEQIARYEDRFLNTNFKIMVMERKRRQLASDSITPRVRQVELLSEYDNILNLLHPVLEWLKAQKEDLKDLWEARVRGDVETARDIEEAMDLEPAYF
ncbi:hypothetical protein MFRU_049g00110 [Monilinia fructicola]|uniref:SPX domain-containing protein n=1 Tax=Monilinia fructicola TaxID=38448 RepID=A0A5M9JZP9_MONFR|nr:hypothetical protein EYC84_003971 [Monilinia fructicola]KAG4025840.1 hypothetical protein MFRU_049g00110 [Monilinia fructicola]